MKHLLVSVCVLFILGVSADFSLGQDSKSLKAAQKRIAELESILSEERRNENERPLTEKQIIGEIKAIRKELGKVDAELRAFKNLGETQADTMLRMLQEPIETKALREKVQLRLALEYLYDKFDYKLPILANRAAFADVFGPESENPYEAEVSLPAIPSKMPAGSALRMLLRQLKTGPATYVLRGSYVEIVPEKYNTSRYFLFQPLVVARYEKRALSDVLRSLAADTGAAIHLDPNVHKENTLITASFRNCSLEDTLVVVTEMAQLKFAVLERSIFVTSRENAKTIEQEEGARNKKRATFKSIFDPLPPENAAQNRRPTPPAVSSSNDTPRLRR